MSDHRIIDWPAWTASPPGRYVLAWEQAQLDHVVGDIFGYHALQLGLPQLDALRENRMPYRGLVLDNASRASTPYAMPPSKAARPASDGSAGWSPRFDPLHGGPAGHAGDDPRNGREGRDGRASVTPLPSRGLAHAPGFARSTIWCEFVELPFEAQSVDLVVMPHTLEFTPDPHRLLREVERVLMPDGQLVIAGFNSLSLWGMRQSMGRMTRNPFVPGTHDLIAFTRLKDWIKLLGFEFDRGRFGCYRPPLLTDKWLARYEFMESAGDRWWPIFGATYMITAVKRVRGMRLVGPKWAKKPALAPGLAPVATPNSHSSIERKIQ
ncbi:class I SAM-dependent methyltransferase [Pararobbsia silviterrae]|uniref:SAM-dependent methyltransferase n=1 Tax=Pararobbsia silviterrae TaxID=1792498 RepID=A0A494Y4I6_9BURK|nr:class I SAM-dependent methyltransferase [Pararobbsia silviterrae]RKP56423.1 SAM-dependent methyltransferase [Pararobbsia silviterrae]